MARRLVGSLLTAAGAAPPGHTSQSDSELLKRFAEANDQAAFATVVHRHAAMVLGVCQRTLRTRQDAEDASQAVFLILSTKAKSLRWRDSVANWLYTTARKVARNAHVAQVRRAKREGAAARPESVSAVDTMSGRELIELLDQELDKLAPRYREPLVLCYLEGLTRDEAASRLGVSVATLKSQLERGRKKLTRSLAARGYALGTVLFSALAGSSVTSASPMLLHAILAAVAGSPSASALSLSRGVAMNGLLTKTKLVLLAFAGLIAMSWALATDPRQSATPQKNTSSKSTANEDKPGKSETKASPATPRIIKGKVLGSDGKPIVAELYSVSPRSQLNGMHAKLTLLSTTNEDGTFQVSLPPISSPSWYSPTGFLLAKAKGHGFDFVDTTENSTTEVTLRLPKENPIRGRVLDTQGKPVAGVQVAVKQGMTYERGSVERYLKRWSESQVLNGQQLPDGDRFIGLYRTPDSDAILIATTDRDGRFEILNVGEEHLVGLTIRGAGIADTKIGVMNRKGFDPKPYNEAPIDPRVKDLSMIKHALRLYGPEANVIVEKEKIIRGTVTDSSGKPRAGVTVAFSRLNKKEVNPDYNVAETDRDGKYEIRGARKHPSYMVECHADPQAGFLPCQAFADDTGGYEPVVIDLKCAKGVVFSGTIIDKGTGKPIMGTVYMVVLANNPFVKEFPAFLNSASIGTYYCRVGTDGRFRVVGIPGPIVLAVAAENSKEYKLAKADPDYPDYFQAEKRSLKVPQFNSGSWTINGSWCKVFNAKETDQEIKVDVELEPAPLLGVNVVDADGKPVIGATATGLTHIEYESPRDFPDTEALMVAHLKPDEERLVVAVDAKRKLVGTLIVKGNDKNPVIKLGTGAKVTGRVVDSNGKPIPNMTVDLYYTRREVSMICSKLSDLKGSFKEGMEAVSDANGLFELSLLFPGQEFKLFFHKGVKRFGPDYDKLPKYKAEKHGEILKLGDMELAATKVK